MNKISGILPSSARVTSVDLKASGTARPGGPNFGRPVGRSAPARADLSTAQKAMVELDKLERMKPPLEPQVKIVHDMADKFFMTPKVQSSDIDLNDPAYQIDEEALLQGFKPEEELQTIDYAFEALDALESPNSEEDGLDRAITGSYLDVRV